MQCLRCKSEMKQYPFKQNMGIYGAWTQPNPFYAEEQKSHNPQSVYICNECGYVEFSIRPCENPDV